MTLDGSLADGIADGLMSGSYAGACGLVSTQSGLRGASGDDHQNLPAGGREEDAVAMTERDKVHEALHASQMPAD